jgi:arylsulfatase A-like enzyme
MTTRRGIVASAMALALAAADDATAGDRAKKRRLKQRRRAKQRRRNRLSEANDPERPNVLFVVLDDMADEEWFALPKMLDFFAERGASYPRSICANPVCAPARASLLTGLRSDHTGVLTNQDGAAGVTGGQLFPSLRKHGYKTGGWGKTLNNYRGKLAGFDHYDRKGGSDTQLSSQAGWAPDGRYITDYYRDEIRAWLTANRRDPVAIYLAPISPHPHYVVHPNDVNRYPEVEDPERRTRLQMLASVDRMFASIIAKLTKQGRLDRTLVVAYSDNGFAFGHNGVKSKGGPYRPSTEVTMRAAGPGIEPGATDSRLVAPEDVPVTIAAIAGTTITGADGMDFRSSDRPYVVTQYHAANPLGPWRGLRFSDPDEVYVEFADDRRQFFDLVADPGEQDDLYEGLGQGRKDELAALLAAERDA